ncbi:MAG: DNA repair protein RecO [bacterium]|nr:DNA repair protein RecO [bacterium]
MYRIYQTASFILEGSDFGEANKLISLYTKDFGLVKGFARSVRKTESKLRFHLQDFAFSEVSLVKGRDFWRLTGAKTYEFSKAVVVSLEERKIWARVSRLLSRLLAGEEKNEELFSVLSHGFEFLAGGNLGTKDKQTIFNFEAVLVLRILSSLGYLAERKEFCELTVSPFFSEEILSHAEKVRGVAVAEINRSLRESQM